MSIVRIVNKKVKISTMKKIIILVIFISNLSCKAQTMVLENIIPIEQQVFDKNNEIEVIENTYYKDVNDLFNKYVGVWTGNHLGNHFIFNVSKITYNSSRRSFKVDKLIIKYKITDSSGNILANTLDVSDNDLSVITGDYLDENGETYHLDYMGENFVCGQNGYILIAVVDGGLKMNFSYSIRGETTSACTTGPAQQILPSFIQLNKE